jgi:hypothetical protein
VANLDSRNKRESAIGLALPVPFHGPNPDGAISSAADRAHLATLYSGIAVTTSVLGNIAFTVALRSRALTLALPELLTLTNLFSNAGFESWALSDPPDDWAHYSPGGQARSTAVQDSDAKEGSYSVKITAKSDGMATPHHCGIVQYINPANAYRGMTLAFDCAAKAASANDNTQTLALLDNGTGDGGYLYLNPQHNDTWARLSGTMTVRADATIISLWLLAKNWTATPDEDDVLWIDDLIVVVGSLTPQAALTVALRNRALTMALRST